jgi:hypothetical protein
MPTAAATASAAAPSRYVSRSSRSGMVSRSRCEARSATDTVLSAICVMVSRAASPASCSIADARSATDGRTMKLQGSCIIRASFERYRANAGQFSAMNRVGHVQRGIRHIRTMTCPAYPNDDMSRKDDRIGVARLLALANAVALKSMSLVWFSLSRRTMTFASGGHTQPNP